MTAWLRVQLDNGMFSDEVAVTYPASTGRWQKSVFVPASCVRGKIDSQGEVKVKVVDRDGTKYAVLPSSQGDIVQIEGADLVQQ
jgi:hypothetical protein